MPPKPAILLDSNAGAPLHSSVKRALFAFLDTGFPVGNPSSTHAVGRAAAAYLAEAEAAILRTFRVSPRDWSVTFTGGGTEANQLAVRSALRSSVQEGEASKWAVSGVEHACVRDLFPEMEREGVRVQTLPTDRTGEVKGIESALKEAKLLSVIGVGNETGIFQHHLTSHILKRMKAQNERLPFVHVDYVAGWGKAALDLSEDGAPDFVTIAGHKLGGLSGSGALVHRKAFRVERPGTPNLAGIVALRALADQWGDIVGAIERLAALRDAFETELSRRFPSVLIAGSTLPRVPTVSHFRFPGLRKNISLVEQLDLRGFAVSAGSACASHSREASHVLLAMGVPDLEARNSVRLSLHCENSADELAEFLDALSAILKRHEVA